MKAVTNYLKKIIVFLGHFGEGKQPIPFATAFLVSVNTVFYLITAKHVVLDEKSKEIKDNELYAFYNVFTPGRPYWRDLGSFRRVHKFEWIFHSNPEVDIAMLPFPIEPEIDALAIPDKLIGGESDLFELNDIFFLSYQPGVTLDSISPVFRSGTISRLNRNNSFFIDAAAFPGNSGSPVFTKPLVVRNGKKLEETKIVGGKFIGVISSTIPYQEVAISEQTGRARVIFEENTGLSLVWRADFIMEIQKSEAFKRQLTMIEEEEKNKLKRTRIP